MEPGEIEEDEAVRKDLELVLIVDFENLLSELETARII